MATLCKKNTRLGGLGSVKQPAGSNSSGLPGRGSFYMSRPLAGKPKGRGEPNRLIQRNPHTIYRCVKPEGPVAFCPNRGARILRHPFGARAFHIAKSARPFSLATCDDAGSQSQHFSACRATACLQEAVGRSFRIPRKGLPRKFSVIRPNIFRSAPAGAMAVKELEVSTFGAPCRAGEKSTGLINGRGLPKAGKNSVQLWRFAKGAN